MRREKVNGLKVESVTSYRQGVWLHDLQNDLVTTIAAVKDRSRPGITPPAKAIFDFGASFFRPMHYYYIDWKDPLPSWTVTKGFAHYLSRLVRKSLIGRIHKKRGVL